MLLGYHLDPDATEAAFDEHGYFKTGDIGRRDGDYWFIKGRASMDSRFINSRRGFYKTDADVL